MAFHIVLVEPEIPYNTGNIARTCAAVGAGLHLVRPLGFSTDDKYLKRAGCDYWHEVNITYYDSIEEVQEALCHHRFFYCTKKAEKVFTDFTFKDEDVFVLGKESAGLPEDLLKANRERCMRIPMRQAVRSLNLSNAAAIVVYEALRQVGYTGLD